MNLSDVGLLIIFVLVVTAWAGVAVLLGRWLRNIGRGR